MLMPVSQSLLIQAPLVVIGFLLGPTAVVTFSTTRTLARAGTAVTNMLNGTLQGEYSVAFGQKDEQMLRKVLRYHQLASGGLILCYALAIYALHRPLMALYTHGQVQPTALFFGLMTLAIAAEMMWSSISTPLSSINRHVTFSYLSLAICVIGMVPLYLLTASMDLVGAAAAMLAIHIAILLLCYMLRHNIAVGRSADPAPDDLASLALDFRGPTRKGCT
jgi:O-antigen/teichoic acid export membrane protein